MIDVEKIFSTIVDYDKKGYFTFFVIAALILFVYILTN